MTDERPTTERTSAVYPVFARLTIAEQLDGMEDGALATDIR